MNGKQTNGDRVADACLSRLARSFSEKCPPSDTCPLPSQLDDLCLACLLLAAEWGGHAPATTTEELTACGEKVSGRFWGDLLPWQLALPTVESIKKLESKARKALKKPKP